MEPLGTKKGVLKCYKSLSTESKLFTGHGRGYSDSDVVNPGNHTIVMSGPRGMSLMGSYRGLKDTSEIFYLRRFAMVRRMMAHSPYISLSILLKIPTFRSSFKLELLLVRLLED
jgi:hypothetical protein